jgi:hypothetical protein
MRRIFAMLAVAFLAGCDGPAPVATKSQGGMAYRHLGQDQWHNDLYIYDFDHEGTHYSILIHGSSSDTMPVILNQYQSDTKDAEEKR